MFFTELQLSIEKIVSLTEQSRWIFNDRSYDDLSLVLLYRVLHFLHSVNKRTVTETQLIAHVAVGRITVAQAQESIKEAIESGILVKVQGSNMYNIEVFRNA